MSLKPRRVDFNATWGAIKDTIKGVITLDHVARAVWNDRFSDVYSICVAHPEPMADRLYAETKQYLIDHVAKLLDKVQEDGEQYLVKNYFLYWSQYSVGSQYLHSLYLYLNQQHIKTQKLSDAEIIYGSSDSSGGEQMEIGELALDVWTRGMIVPLGSRLVKLLLEAIAQDRAQETLSIPIEAVRGTILSFVEVQGYRKKGQLQLYQVLFEEAFLDDSGEHFKRSAARLLQEKNVSLYMEKVKAKIEEELFRARRFLHHSSFPKVSHRCETHMVAEHLQFLYSECSNMVQQERRKDLSNMYDLLKSVQNAIVVLVDTVLDYIKTQGLAAIGNLQGENIHISFVENLLAVYKKYKELIKDVFKSDQNFMGALDKACSYVINHRPNQGRSPCRSPELLAKYCDTLLKKSSKGISETEVDEKLAESITIFKYIDDKDIFQKFYARMLAKRLIHQQTQSMDAEESMINRLKQACGYEFTSKLHRMFTDMSVSSDLNNKFNSFLKNDNIDLGINFGIYVLQAGAWPLGQAIVTPFALPQQLEKSVQKFEAFYHNRFNGRKLTWLHHLCQAELKLNHLKRTYVVTVQTFQMAILLLFENVDSLTCKDIKETLQLNNEQFYRHVVSLVDSKLLLADAEELTPEVTLKLNMEYSNKRTKFRITAAVQKETPHEVEQTMNSVEEDRKMYLQAAIVRIMKSRKVLKHNLLIQEVYAQSKVSFAPSVQLIKKCIESLIDKQYIERTPHSSEEYSYVA
ncbi:cullin-2 [Diorhabda carinulata]|uniref:cullin-2 n=2 Tax=Diorhabda TaxID=217246 RepID=UPI0024E05407|nr:cullin-2 isoform X2 [Diorhabda sublineata]XP_056637622.1 cullin-2 isoform X2 [Diorhabda sublineata]XP_057654993.1 cullin-2 [Diorhabda carinulata]XP_057654994.1 cullin-2 [Diorhabda carinulata]XP_057654995.1 cullin-2 [Diorhabda carinulata]